MKVLPDNAQHIGQRGRQEDSFAFSDFNDLDFAKKKGYLAIIADGMGGMTHGKEASQLAVRAFLEAYATNTSTLHLHQHLHDAFIKANEEVRNYAVQLNQPDEVGTTLTAAVILDEVLYWISAGDTRIYLLRDGELIQLTRDHNYLNYLYQEVQRGNMKKEEAEQHPSSRALTSFLGLPSIPEVDQNIKPFHLKDGDIVLLCSDGLYEFMDENEICTLMKQYHSEATQILIESVIAKKHPHQDNITILSLTYLKDQPELLEDRYEKSLEAPFENDIPSKQKRKMPTVFLFSLLFLFTIIGGYISVVYFAPDSWNIPEEWKFPIDWIPFTKN